MIKGIDISNWNWSTLAVQDFAPLHDPDSFVIMKATEGITFKDRAVDLYTTILKGYPDGGPAKGRLYGYYHYARPELNNDPVSEALNFWRVVGAHAGSAVFALDVEGNAFNLPADKLDRWVLTWLQTIEGISGGVKPLVYCSASRTSAFPSAAEGDYGLWVAKWSTRKPLRAEIKPWSLWAIWQKNTGGGLLDQDVFNGTAEQFLKYAARR